MHHTTGSRQAFFVYRWIILGFLLIILPLISASAYAEGYLSGRVWNDLNNDGLMDASEPGVEAVLLTVKRQDNGDSFTATSDSTGAYIFQSLPNDSYTLTIEVPDSMLYARYRKEGGDLRSVFTGEDLNITRTFIVRDYEPQTNINIGLVDSSIIQGLAYLDVNYNGNYDEGEPPYPNVAVEVIRNASDRSVGKIYTGNDGTFYFNAIRTGNYRLRAIVPDDGSLFTRIPDVPGVFSNLFEARPGRRENSILSIDTENSMVYEYYIGLAVGGKITGTVFTDKNYSGVLEKSDSKLSNVKVQLLDENGTILDEVKTSNKGTYTFTGVMPGQYKLHFLRNDGYTFTKYRPDEEGGNRALLTQDGTYGETALFPFTMGETLTDVNAGMVQSAALSGIFFYDENDNGLMDANEGGFVDGIVRMISQDGEIDLSQPVNVDGSYSFSGLVPTEYTIFYLLPEHAELAKVVNGGNTLAHQGLENTVTNVSLQAKKSYTRPLIGAVKLGTFEGFAFEDLNANNVCDAGEAMLAGVTLSFVSKVNPQNAAAVTTGSNGMFSITGLRPDDYNLEISLPEGMIFAGDILASNIVTDRTDRYASAIPFSKLLNRETNAIGAVIPAALQASVWLDENRNASQEADERLLNDLEFSLFDEATQTYIMTARTDASGNAVFHNVRPSSYTVSFTLPEDAQPVDGVGTFTQSGRTMQQSGIAVRSGETYSAISAGVVCTTSLGGVIAVEQASGRTPVEGVEVQLYDAGNAVLYQTVLSDANGNYRFDGLWPGSYVIHVIRPNGLVFIRPSDPALQTDDSIIADINNGIGISEPIQLRMADDLLQNRVLFTIPAKIGNQVWLDQNQNGLIDGDEPMINGTIVNLMQNGVPVYTTTSNEWGYYEFDDIYPGEYTLQAIAYPELTITTPVLSLGIISSCLVSGDGTLAESNPFTVTSGSVNFFYHLGYVLKEGTEMPSAITEGSHQIWPKTN